MGGQRFDLEQTSSKFFEISSDGLAIALVFVAIVLLFLVGVVAYLVPTFYAMSTHTEKRPLRTTLRSVFVEAFWVLITQPLFVFFYIFGGRARGGSRGVPIVFVHGYLQNRVVFLRMARAIRRETGRPTYAFNYDSRTSIARIAGRLEAFVNRICAESGATEVDIVAHSLGGVVAFEYLSSEHSRARRCVTIASPHQGVMWRGPLIGPSGAELRAGSAYFGERGARELRVPCLSIASTHDNVVHPSSTSSIASRGGTDAVVANCGHLSILFAPDVIARVTQFIS